MLKLLFIALFIPLTAQATVKTDIERAAQMVGVPTNILLAVCWTESRFSISAPTRPNDGIGVCQVRLGTAQHMDKMYKHKYLATTERLSNPFINAFYAAKYLKYQLKRYDGRSRLAIEAYNYGTAHRGVSSYVQKVSIAFYYKPWNLL